MSAKDKATVKAAIATYIADRAEVTIKELRDHVTEDTGLTFGQTTIARFIVDMGWGKKGCDAFTTIYTRNAPDA